MERIRRSTVATFGLVLVPAFLVVDLLRVPQPALATIVLATLITAAAGHREAKAIRERARASSITSDKDRSDTAP